MATLCALKIKRKENSVHFDSMWTLKAVMLLQKEKKKKLFKMNACYIFLKSSIYQIILDKMFHIS